ncbi:MAG: hypothetical protein ASARMPREDX12_004371 [Alectoria sarmentosa]|nr:MAG: hypothetical protein ASARMPREDX12_004371 [Alectoria sarmentosa]
MATVASNVNLEANEQGVTLKATIPFAIIAVIAVTCRFVSRKIQSSRYEFDDYMIVVGLISTVPPANGPQYFKCLFAYEILYGSAIASIKLSVLSLYRRIFSVARFKLAANIVTAMVVAWVIALVLTAIFTCNPVNGFWDKTTTKSKCLDTEHFFIGNAVANMGTDLIILALPLQKIWRLNMQRNQKIALSFIFLLGGFVVVASAIRLATQFQVNNPDFTWALNGTVIWSSIEPSIAVTSACLPTLRPLALYLFPQLASRVTRYEPDLERKKFMHRARGYAHMGSPWPGFENHKTSAGGPTASIFASLDNGDPKHDVILDQIKVHKDLHLTSEAV